MAMTEFKDVDGVKFTNGVATKVATLSLSSPPSASEFTGEFGAASLHAGKIFFCVKTGAASTAYFVTSNGTDWFYKSVSLSL